ncbi:unnamed protein product [Spirodela intermedia]|uniref:Uncharacterized protein n=1 Tax=Spirodela intermedia TaxID=51605 RepID=A0A7I8IP16_SPIIN|nr:unnamed protein product [Spirodela intermedia]CAA6658881.1 unnamed protein product [Spirodela intermedia]
MEGEAKTEGGEGKLAANKLPLPVAAASPCSSPSHEFSFTISFHHPSSSGGGGKSPLSRCHVYDLAPADDIFFHGHLLPLQILSHTPPPVPARASEAAAVPAAAAAALEQSRRSSGSAANTVSSSSSCSTASSGGENRERMKKKLVSSLFTGVGRWWKTPEAGERDEDEEKRRKKRTAAFDAMSRLVKKYVAAVEPLFSFRGGTEKRHQLQRRPYSFTGNSNAKATMGRDEQWRRRRESSPRRPPCAPPPPTAASSWRRRRRRRGGAGGSSEESTMEELQSAIEAAIAHCKNSIAATKEKGFQP